MRTPLIAVLVLLATSVALADHPDTRAALDADPAIAAPAMARLRAAGQGGLDALLEAHAGLLKADAAISPEVTRLRGVLDTVAAQKDAHASRLYWHTDLKAAISAATQAKKPILSLHLLGRLDQDMSCANSRFFRTTLYPDPVVSDYLRKNFILHWHSVRPVPRVTLDFGDGRRIERTITGNSVHYILNPAGRPIDALPGLYSADAFLKGIKSGQALATEMGRSAPSPAGAEEVLAEHHAERSRQVTAQWSADLVKLGLTSPADAGQAENRAMRANELAMTKLRVETPILRQLVNRPALERATTAGAWVRIADLHPENRVIRPEVQAFLRQKQGAPAVTAQQGPSETQDPMFRMLTSLQASIAEDTVRNEYTLHTQIHDWFASRTAPADLIQMNEKVYTELFLMPPSDPSLGLDAPDVFTGLDAAVKP